MCAASVNYQLATAAKLNAAVVVAVALLDIAICDCGS